MYSKSLCAFESWKWARKSTGDPCTVFRQSVLGAGPDDLRGTASSKTCNEKVARWSLSKDFASKEKHTDNWWIVEGH
jgi:hypothetical protein